MLMMLYKCLLNVDASFELNLVVKTDIMKYDIRDHHVTKKSRHN